MYIYVVKYCDLQHKNKPNSFRTYFVLFIFGKYQFIKNTIVECMYMYIYVGGEGGGGDKSFL